MFEYLKFTKLKILKCCLIDLKQTYYERIQISFRNLYRIIRSIMMYNKYLHTNEYIRLFTIHENMRRVDRTSSTCMCGSALLFKLHIVANTYDHFLLTHLQNPNEKQNILKLPVLNTDALRCRRSIVRNRMRHRKKQ